MGERESNIPKQNLLGITRDRIYNVIRENADDFKNEKSMRNFIDDVWFSIKADQPVLFDFIKSHKPDNHILSFYYDQAFAISYTFLPDTIKEEELDQSHIVVAQRSLDYHYDDDKSGQDLEWFFEKVATTMPAFYKWVEHEGVQIPQENYQRYAFYYGITAAILPFYMREEARKLESIFYST